VQRESGTYKVQVSFDEMLSMTAELYAELIKEPRPLVSPAPATLCPRLALSFDRAKEKTQTSMRTRAKRLKAANATLDPWRSRKAHMPTILKIMDGVDVNPAAGFQTLAMQLAIYAVSMDMALPEFLDRCRGLVNAHESDSYRYNSVAKRERELARMWEYMAENSLYEFDTGPIVRLLKPGVPALDLGQADLQDHEPKEKPKKAKRVEADEARAPTTPDEADEAEKAWEESEAEEPDADSAGAMFAGIRHTKAGVYKKTKEGNMVVICPASFSGVTSVFQVDSPDHVYKYEAQIHRRAMPPTPISFAPRDITSAAGILASLSPYGVMFQGTDPEARGLGHYLQTRAMSDNRRVYVSPREGVTLMAHPRKPSRSCVVYLSQDQCMNSIPEDDPDYFELKYHQEQAVSTYRADIHMADDLGPQHIPSLTNLFKINRPEVVADMVGWFVACYYRSFYHRMYQQFPLLQVFGEAGSGKSQTVMLLARLHWTTQEGVNSKSAMSLTPFALDSQVSSSSSLPLILEEYKPAEMRAFRGKHEKLKDVFKNSFNMGEVGNRGTLHKGSGASYIGVARSVASAPIVFIGESAETETALVHRSIVVPLNRAFHTPTREAAFRQLQAAPDALSALGKSLLMSVFHTDIDKMRAQFETIQAKLHETVPKDHEGRATIPDRNIYGRCVVVQALTALKEILHGHFGDQFDETLDSLIALRSVYTGSAADAAAARQGRSEISKVIHHIAHLSHPAGDPREHHMIPNVDYIVGDGWIEIKPETAYLKYLMSCHQLGSSHPPLFPTLESFFRALQDYKPVVDLKCPNSELHEHGNGEDVYRLDLQALKNAHVNKTFKPF
jgi:hypothetical protein